MPDRRRLVIDVVAAGAARAPGLARWLESVAPPRARGTMTVAVVPDARVRVLNRRYRRKDRATDVLSFPAAEPGQLGDVVIAAGVARRQAAQAGHAFGTELRVLALHGLLHLLGYDHERDNGRMARLERRLRRTGGLREGLIERVPRLRSGQVPRLRSGQVPRLRSGQVPRLRSGQVPRLRSGQVPRLRSGQVPRLRSGQAPRPRAGHGTR